jgi:hypothetical protein
MTYQDESALPFSDHVSKLDGPAKFLKWNSHGPALRQRKRRLQPLPAAARHAGKAWSLRLATFGRRGSSGVRCEKYRLEAYATLKSRRQSASLRGRQRKRRLQPLPAAAHHAGKAWSLRLRDLWPSRLLRRSARKIQAGSLCYFEPRPPISMAKTQRAPN